MLFGEKIRLRAVEPGDVQIMQRWLNDLEGLLSARSVPQLRSRKELEKGLDARDTAGQQMAIETLDGRHIGLAQIRDIDWVHRHADLEILIGEADYRGRGFEEDTIRVMAGYAFRVLNLHRLGATLAGDSDRLRKAFEGCGFQVEGRREDYYWASDRYLDQVQVRLLAHEFPRGAQ